MNRVVKELTLQALIATTYVVLTFVFQSVSFLSIQFRISEVLLILVLFNSKNAMGILLGTMIANMFSPMALFDVVFGTMATYLAIWFMLRLRNKIYIYLAPAVLNGIIIGISLNLVLDLPLIYSMFTVFISEIFVTMVPWLLFEDLLRKNDELKRIFG